MVSNTPYGTSFNGFRNSATSKQITSIRDSNCVDLGYIFFSMSGTVLKRGAQLQQMSHSFSNKLSFFAETHICAWLGLAKAVPTFRYRYLSAVFKIQTYCIWIRMLAFCRIRIWTGPRLYWIRIQYGSGCTPRLFYDKNFKKFKVDQIFWFSS
jgi:hypothetical protein